VRRIVIYWAVARYTALLLHLAHGFTIAFLRFQRQSALHLVEALVVTSQTDPYDLLICVHFLAWWRCGESWNVGHAHVVAEWAEAVPGRPHLRQSSRRTSLHGTALV